MSPNKNTPAVTLETTIQRSQELLASNIGDEVVMMSIENSAYYGLDPVGSKIWEMISEPMRVSDLCEQLMERFDVSAEQCQADVLKFLNEMYDEGMLQVK